MPSRKRNVILIGAGIIGAATARALMLRRPSLCLTIVEKESAPALHQTGHNSGVVHAGIYYKPGSLKARLCVAGAARMRDFAVERGIPYQSIGKLIVASCESSADMLNTLYDRAVTNQVRGVQRITREQIKDYEPHATGVAGLWSPNTGIIDYAAVTRAYVDDICKSGGEIVTNAEIKSVSLHASGCVVSTTQGEYEADMLVNCAGLHSDRIALLSGVEPGIRIIPFRGEYYHLSDIGATLVRGLIYPVPDPNMPFLGVHFTRSVHQSVEAGPNAVLALAREGYRKSDVVMRDIAQTIAWPGFQKMALQFWRTGVDEMRRSFSKRRFAASLQELVPEIRPEHLAAGGSGVRAQAVDTSGKLVDDFKIVAVPGAIHVLNVPSPAATASLAIGDLLADDVCAMLD